MHLFTLDSQARALARSLPRGGRATTPSIRAQPPRREPSAGKNPPSETFADAMGLAETAISKDTNACSCSRFASLEGPNVDYKLVSIKNGGIRAEQRCKRTDCIFPRPTIGFDFEDDQIVASWRWFGVEVNNVANGVKIHIRPTLLRVRISCN